MPRKASPPPPPEPRTVLDIKGASGAVYRYRRAERELAQSAMGGNFVYVREDGEHWVVVFAGEADNLSIGLWEDWDEAQADHGATEAFARLNVGRAVRADELRDIVEALKPAMNG